MNTKSEATNADACVDRIMQMLDVGMASIRSGDELGALLAVQEAHKIATSLPICLPDRSRERVNG